MKLQYSKACMSDLDEVFSLVQNAIATMNEQNIPQWDEIYPDRAVLCDDIDRGQLYIGTMNDRIAVIYVLNQDCDEQYQNGQWLLPDKEFMVVHRLCVNPKWANQGIAKTTMLHIEAEVAKMGIQAIRLDAFTLNPFALKLYEGLGYSKTGYANWRKGKFYLMEKYL